MSVVIKWSSFSAVLATLLMSTSSFAADSAKPSIKVGVIAPLTLGNAAMGEDIHRSVELVVKQFNSSEASKYQYELVVEDGQCGSGNAASQAVNKLINLDAVDGLVVGCSGEILQSAQRIEQHKVPTVVVYSSHPAVKELGPHIFRVFVDAGDDIPVIGAQILKDGRSRVALLTEELPFTFAIRDVLQEQLGNKVILSSHFREGEQDFRTLLLRVRAAKPDALFLNAGAVDTLGAMVKQAAELRLDYPLYSFAYAAADSFIENFGSYAEGLVYVGPPDFRSEGEEGRKLLSQFQTTFGEEPNVPFVAATAYDGATALLSALDSSGRDAKSAIAALSAYRAKGVLGQLSFDSNREIQGLHYVIRTIPVKETSTADAER